MSNKKSSKIIRKLLGEGVKPADDLMSISADWKDPQSLIDQLLEKLPELGVYVVVDPDTEDSDEYGLLLSRTPITAERIEAARYMKPEGDEDGDDEDGG